MSTRVKLVEPDEHIKAFKEEIANAALAHSKRVLFESDKVNHPAHYTSDKVECIDAMEQVYGKQAVIAFCMCNAFKYNWRADLKNGDEDLQKARWYMKKAKELLNK